MAFLFWGTYNLTLQIKKKKENTLRIKSTIDTVQHFWSGQEKKFHCILEEKEFTEIESLVKALLDEWASKHENL